MASPVPAAAKKTKKIKLSITKANIGQFQRNYVTEFLFSLLNNHN
jgi:hypothetical protein